MPPAVVPYPRNVASAPRTTSRLSPSSSCASNAHAVGSGANPRGSAQTTLARTRGRSAIVAALNAAASDARASRDARSFAPPPVFSRGASFFSEPFASPRGTAAVPRAAFVASANGSASSPKSNPRTPPGALATALGAGASAQSAWRFPSRSHANTSGESMEDHATTSPGRIARRSPPPSSASSPSNATSLGSSSGCRIANGPRRVGKSSPSEVAEASPSTSLGSGTTCVSPVGEYVESASAWRAQSAGGDASAFADAFAAAAAAAPRPTPPPPPRASSSPSSPSPSTPRSPARSASGKRHQSACLTGSAHVILALATPPEDHTTRVPPSQ